jgi:hypothetical protein
VARDEVALVSNLLLRLRQSGCDQAQITAELDACDYVGNSALTKACEVGDVDLVQLLVREGASKDLETPTGKTPLVECAKFGSVECARFLIEDGVEMDLVTKNKTTAFDWALNRGEARVLRHMVREYRVQKDLASLFRMVNAGDIRAVKHLVKEGEPYRQNLQHFIEKEIAECDEEVEESEALMKELRLDLAVKEPQLSEFLATEARELARVKQLREEAATNKNEGGLIVAAMLAEYDESMLFLQHLSKTDITEVTDIGDEKLAPPQARRLAHAAAVLLGLKPRVVVDQRKERLFGMARRQRAQGMSVEETLSRNGGSGGAANNNRNKTGGEKEDWWGALRQFLGNPNCISNMRFLNKTALDEERVREVMAMAGQNGKGIGWTKKHREWKYGDEEEVEEEEDDEGGGGRGGGGGASSSGGWMNDEGAPGEWHEGNGDPRDNFEGVGGDGRDAHDERQQGEEDDDDDDDDGGSWSRSAGGGGGSRNRLGSGCSSSSSGGGGGGAGGGCSGFQQSRGQGENGGGSAMLDQGDSFFVGEDGLQRHNQGQLQQQQLMFGGESGSSSGDVGGGGGHGGGIVNFEGSTLLELQHSGAFGFLLPKPSNTNTSNHDGEEGGYMGEEGGGEGYGGGGGGYGGGEWDEGAVDPERRWKLMEALSRWLRAVLAYYEASKIHAKLKERELADQRRWEKMTIGGGDGR